MCSLESGLQCRFEITYILCRVRRGAGGNSESYRAPVPFYALTAFNRGTPEAIAGVAIIPPAVVAGPVLVLQPVNPASVLAKIPRKLL